jgi:DNA helicase-2/ATP-dependent DNA helicase PcrA
MTRSRERLTLTLARSRTIFGSRMHSMPSRFLDELPQDGVEWEREAPAWGGAGVPRGGGESPRPQFRAPELPRIALSVGDEVRHATLGEGIVTGVDRDGIVVVRFRDDRSERRLVLGYAPLEKI